MNIHKFVATAVFVSFFTASPGEAGRVYMWVDKQGVTQIKDHPPENIPEDQMETFSFKDRPPSTSPPPTKEASPFEEDIEEWVPEPTPDTAGQESDRQQRREEAVSSEEVPGLVVKTEEQQSKPSSQPNLRHRG